MKSVASLAMTVLPPLKPGFENIFSAEEIRSTETNWRQSVTG
jgi:hypothetical protein